MKSRNLSLALAALGLVAGAARAQSCPGVAPWVFADVPASHAFCTYVTWMAQNDVTLGCRVIDANHREYCPDDNVTRLQMAAFMSRLGDALFPSTCAAGQVMKWNGATWTCADDSLGGSGGDGTVTSVLAGTGLTASPNPITGAGSINLAASYRLPQACAANQVPKWIAGAWACANDADTNSGGTVTSLTQGSGIVLAPNPVVGAGTISADTAYLQRRVSASCAVGSSIRAVAADGSVTCEIDDVGPANAFVHGGNAFGATATLGTSDNRTLSLMANNVTSLRVQPTTADPGNGYDTATPNLIGGWVVNAAYAGVVGATIGGGGGEIGGVLQYNLVTDHYGTVGGGSGNTAGDALGTRRDSAHATVGGGLENTAGGIASTVGGGYDNSATGPRSTVGGGGGNSAVGAASVVGGGDSNTADGDGSTVGGGTDNTAAGFISTVGGGVGNSATGSISTVGGGFSNSAAGTDSTVAGGIRNSAAGAYSAVIGGYENEARGDNSIAMGRRAKAFNGANIGHGSIVIADGNDFDFNIGTHNRFGVRATGGVYLALGLDAAGNTTWTCQASNGNAWACASDRNLKHSLVELDARAVLEKVAALPVYQWQPKGQNAHVLHYGPMAQDFHAAFGLGDDDKMIGMQDADGVALAAIKGLNAKVEEQAREIAQLRALVERLIAAR